MHKDHERYVRACEYPGVLDEAAVEKHLADYLKALGVTRQIVRLRQGWTLQEHPSLARYVSNVLDDFGKRSGRNRPPLDARDALAARAALDALAARAARDARAALDALDARDARAARDARDARAAFDRVGNAEHRFASWCIQGWGWWWGVREMSWISTTFLGSRTEAVRAWSEPYFEAYCAGAWLLHFTDDTLYWAAKPIVHVERNPAFANGRRMHNDKYAALESDIENLYFWKGVLVPAFVVVRPDWITVQHIETEENAEVRRVMIERYGVDRYVSDSGAQVVHADLDQYDRPRRLFVKEVTDDEPIVMVEVTNSSPEPDGHFKTYMLRVDPNAYEGRASRECHAAIASTWRRKGDLSEFVFKIPESYRPLVES